MRTEFNEQFGTRFFAMPMATGRQQGVARYSNESGFFVTRYSFTGLYGEITIDSPQKQDELLEKLKLGLILDSLGFPADLKAAQGNFVGKVKGNSFRFARFLWFTGKFMPICTGRIYENGEKTIINAKVFSWSLILVPVAVIYLVCYLLGELPGNILLFAGIIVVLYTVVASFYLGFKDIRSFLCGLVES